MNIANTGAGVKNLAIGIAIFGALAAVVYLVWKGKQIVEAVAGEAKDQLGIVGIGAPRDSTQVVILRGQREQVQSALDREVANQAGFAFEGTNIATLRAQLKEIDGKLSSLGVASSPAGIAAAIGQER